LNTLLKDSDPQRVAPPPVVLDDFKMALGTVRPSVAQEDLARSEAWTRAFGEEGT
jgi:hypothetical protein